MEEATPEGRENDKVVGLKLAKGRMGCIGGAPTLNPGDGGVVV